MQFIKCSESKYLCDIYHPDVTLTKINGSYFFKIQDNIVRWQSGFATIDCATKFYNRHSNQMIHATEDHIDYSPDDLEFLIDNFRFAKRDNNQWISKIDDVKLIISPQPHSILLTIESNNKTSTAEYFDFDKLLADVEGYFGDDIFASAELISSRFRNTVITAATNSRDLAKDLVRVKSSNLWAYNINIKDKKDKTGDMVIQFKGRKGGPGDIYLYYDVPILLWRKFITAPSKGHFFWMNIRNNFNYRKLTGNKHGVLKNAVN